MMYYEEYENWILKNRQMGKSSKFLFIRICDYLFGKNNEYLYLSSYINIAGIVLSLILLMFFDIEMRFWFKVLFYFIFAFVVNPIARIYRACRHYYLKQHHSPGPYGWGTIDVYPYGDVDVHFCTLVNERLTEQLTNEVRNRVRLETELSNSKQRVTQLLQIEQELTSVQKSLSEESKRRQLAESTLEKTKSEKLQVEAKLRSEECLKFSLQKQINDILANPDYKQMLARREQEKKQEEERVLALRRREDEERIAALKRLARQQEEEKAAAMRKKEEEEKEAILQKFREDEKLQQEWAKQIAAAKRRGYEWMDASYQARRRSPQQETSRVIIGPDGRVHTIMDVKDIRNL